MRRQGFLKIWQRTARVEVRGQGSAQVSAQVVQRARSMYTWSKTNKKIQNDSTSIVCRVKLFLLQYCTSSCSFVFKHVLFRSSLFRLCPDNFSFQMVSLLGKVFSGRWSFQILWFYLGRYNDMFLSCNKLHPVWFLTCPTTVTFLASKPYKALLVPKVWRVTPNCYQ